MKIIETKIAKNGALITKTEFDCINSSRKFADAVAVITETSIYGGEVKIMVERNDGSLICDYYIGGYNPEKSCYIFTDKDGNEYIFWDNSLALKQLAKGIFGEAITVKPAIHVENLFTGQLADNDDCEAILVVDIKDAFGKTNSSAYLFKNSEDAINGARLVANTFGDNFVSAYVTGNAEKYHNAKLFELNKDGSEMNAEQIAARKANNYVDFLAPAEADPEDYAITPEAMEVAINAEIELASEEMTLEKMTDEYNAAFIAYGRANDYFNMLINRYVKDKSLGTYNELWDAKQHLIATGERLEKIKQAFADARARDAIIQAELKANAVTFTDGTEEDDFEGEVWNLIPDVSELNDVEDDDELIDPSEMPIPAMPSTEQIDGLTHNINGAKDTLNNMQSNTYTDEIGENWTRDQLETAIADWQTERDNLQCNAAKPVELVAPTIMSALETIDERFSLNGFVKDINQPHFRSAVNGDRRLTIFIDKNGNPETVSFVEGETNILLTVKIKPCSLRDSINRAIQQCIKNRILYRRNHDTQMENYEHSLMKLLQQARRELEVA